ncbi:hypothetical protein KGQ24_01465 [Patescibacteria group bacterium]|nr:hypothetical protein [Patescibacteria group bacterium]
MNNHEGINPGLEHIQGLVPYEVSLAKAKQLYEKYWEQIAQRQREKDPYGRGLKLNTVPEETLKHYNGHGITRGGVEENLAALLNILTNKTIKGWEAPLKSNDGHDAWTGGDFMIISHPDSTLSIREGGKVKKINDLGMEVNIGGVIVAPRMTPIIEELKKLFPNVEIVSGEDAPKYLSSKIKS